MSAVTQQPARFVRPLRLQYSSLQPGWTWERIELEDDHWLEIIGDPHNACYEWLLRSESAGVIRHSDCGYGIPGIALRDGLLSYYGPPTHSSPPVTP